MILNAFATKINGILFAGWMVASSTTPGYGVFFTKWKPSVLSIFGGKVPTWNPLDNLQASFSLCFVNNTFRTYINMGVCVVCFFAQVILFIWWKGSNTPPIFCCSMLLHRYHCYMYLRYLEVMQKLKFPHNLMHFNIRPILNMTNALHLKVKSLLILLKCSAIRVGGR